MKSGSPGTQKKPKQRHPPKRGLVMARMLAHIVGWFKEETGEEGLTSEEDGVSKGSSASTTAPHSAYTSDPET
ncbi:hypothetical protein Scep_004682 [Stephania cephalantha]|uniref:Uncharacterized protein n=1 Tax=Stephania cephalantha TaxID=152367 RepID=A0AAP0PVM8_9MAGN